MVSLTKSIAHHVMAITSNDLLPLLDLGFLQISHPIRKRLTVDDRTFRTQPDRIRAVAGVHDPPPRRQGGQ